MLFHFKCCFMQQRVKLLQPIAYNMYSLLLRSKKLPVIKSTLSSDFSLISNQRQKFYSDFRGSIKKDLIEDKKRISAVGNIEIKFEEVGLVFYQHT